MSKEVSIMFGFLGIVVWNFICAGMNISYFHNNKEACIVVIPSILILLAYYAGRRAR